MIYGFVVLSSKSSMMTAVLPPVAAGPVEEKPTQISSFAVMTFWSGAVAGLVVPAAALASPVSRSAPPLVEPMLMAAVVEPVIGAMTTVDNLYATGLVGEASMVMSFFVADAGGESSASSTTD